MLFRERNPWSTSPLPFKKSFSWEKNCILSDSSSCFLIFLIPVSRRREKHSCGNWLIQISHRASVEKTPLMPIRENIFLCYRRSIIYTKYLQYFSFYLRKMSFVVIVKVPLQWACYSSAARWWVFAAALQAALSRAWHRTERWGEFLLRAMGVPVFPLAALDLKWETALLFLLQLEWCLKKCSARGQTSLADSNSDATS